MAAELVEAEDDAPVAHGPGGGREGEAAPACGSCFVGGSLYLGAKGQLQLRKGITSAGVAVQCSEVPRPGLSVCRGLHGRAWWRARADLMPFFLLWPLTVRFPPQFAEE